MSEPRDVANEIIEGLYDKVAKLHPVDKLMILSYVREQLTAYLQNALANAYICEQEARKENAIHQITEMNK